MYDGLYEARKLSKQDPAGLQLLCGSSVLNYFRQPSTRTFLSFSTAESKLGLHSQAVQDVQTSSYAKGESEVDFLRTISSYFETIVFRHPDDNFGHFALWVMKNTRREIPVISAGTGKKEHPTQALLDYYTWRDSFQGNLGNGSYAFVGDCLRGRTVHSAAKLLALHSNVTLYFVSPEELQIDSETERYLLARKVKVEKINSGLEDVVPLVTKAVYMTRIQNEHGGKGDYPRAFIFTRELLDKLPEGAILMHPMPKREEIDPAIDSLVNDSRVMYWRQHRNGLWIRVALFAHLFGVGDRIHQRYQEKYESKEK